MRQYIVFPMVFLLSGCGLSAAEWGMGAGGAVVGTQIPRNPPPLPTTYVGADGKTHVDAAAVAQNNAQQVADNARTNYETQTSQGLTDFKNNLYGGVQETNDWLLTPPEHKPMKAVPYSYCYTVLQDIMCYRQPMPGWEDRIVAYQGTGAPPPPIAITQPLAHVPLAGEKQATRIASVQPVFRRMPSDEDGGNAITKANIPAQVDSAHETLPDPALAPQL